MVQKPPANPKQQLRTIADTAERLNVSTRTVRRMIDAGELRIIRIGRSVRIDDDDLEKAIARWRQDVVQCQHKSH
jgi:excisionase family DNA binding protein